MEKKKRVQLKPTTNIIPMKLDATFFFEKAVQSMDRYRYDKALKYFKRAAEYEPENPVNHCNLAGLLSEMGNYEESNKILQNVLDVIDPSMTECYFYMANNFANMENYESAEKAIVHYLENDPNGQFLEESEEMMEPPATSSTVRRSWLRLSPGKASSSMTAPVRLAGGRQVRGSGSDYGEAD